MEMAQIKKELLKQKRQIEGRLAPKHERTYFKDESVSADFSLQTKETENDQLVAILEAEGLAELNQLEDAWQRIEKGGFGICTSVT